MFNAAKDAMTSKAALLYANQLMARYGRVQLLRIDSRAKTVEVSCQLDGEPAPIEVRMENYRIETTGGKTFLRSADFRCARPWLQNLLTDLSRSRPLELPSWAAAVL